MSTRTARATGSARWLSVLAVLVGLFLMHGGPGAAMGGCHGVTPAPTSAMSPSLHQVAGPGTAPRTGSPAVSVGSAGMDGTGALCVSTPARDQLPLPPTALAALIVLTLLTRAFGASGRWRALGGRWRGPPVGGRQILLRVCVART
ncbi:hypothetical protein [Streptacidiphilus fuscans]|uniref:Secreted protein n=1 Tax=Streptacidiphilus fuscans TaxID=2789292 RepID=A0A931B0I1_9ACTN|nr:hypothetical protein [Streptacidiphilus fuscans]MBF9066447.1 hypothetical protein [Streptacidiphilus fuscans]